MKYKLIKGFKNYRVSNTGNIQSRQTGKWKSLVFNTSGKYKSVCLCDGKIRKTKRIHRLVADAFCEKPLNSECVRHVDGNPKNNHHSNLAWGTYRQNEDDKLKHGTWFLRMGGAKLKPENVIEIRQLCESGSAQRKVAIQFNVSRPTITRIIQRKIWRHL